MLIFKIKRIRNANLKYWKKKGRRAGKDLELNMLTQKSKNLIFIQGES